MISAIWPLKLADVDSKLFNLIVALAVNWFNAVTALPILPPPIDALNAFIDVATDELNVLMLPVKSMMSFPPLPNRYKVELPLA